LYNHNHSHLIPPTKSNPPRGDFNQDWQKKKKKKKKHGAKQHIDFDYDGIIDGLYDVCTAAE